MDKAEKRVNELLDCAETYRRWAEAGGRLAPVYADLARQFTAAAEAVVQSSQEAE